MKKGDIWLVELPDIGGHEQRGYRPAILLADTRTSVVIVIPCTSNKQVLRFPHTIRLIVSKQNGLDADSIALILQVRAIDRRRLHQKIGELEKSLIKEIDQMLRALLKL
jgi:mRNA interferase MazF